MRDFTLPMDRLPALAGVAGAFGEELGGKYISGLWTKEAEITLFWYLTEPATARPKIRVPTWSWASVTGKVQFYNDLINSVKFLNSHVVYHRDAYMGEVEEARLLISGPVVPAVFYYGQSWLDVLRSAPVQREAGSSLLSTNEWPNELNKDLYGLRVKENFVTFLPDYRLYSHGDNHISSGAEVLCLTFGRTRMIVEDPLHPTEEKEIVAVCCLVLYCVDEEMSYYKRIGYFEGWCWDNSLELDWAMGLSQTRQLALV